MVFFVSKSVPNSLIPLDRLTCLLKWILTWTTFTPVKKNHLRGPFTPFLPLFLSFLSLLLPPPDISFLPPVLCLSNFSCASSVFLDHGIHFSFLVLEFMECLHQILFHIYKSLFCYYLPNSIHNYKNRKEKLST